MTNLLGDCTLIAKTSRGGISAGFSAALSNHFWQDNQITQECVSKSARRDEIRPRNGFVVCAIVPDDPNLMGPIGHLRRDDISPREFSNFVDQVAGKVTMLIGDRSLNSAAIGHRRGLFHFCRVESVLSLAERPFNIFWKAWQNLTRCWRRDKLVSQIKKTNIGIAIRGFTKTFLSLAGIGRRSVRNFSCDWLLTTVAGQPDHKRRSVTSRSVCSAPEVCSNYSKRLVSPPAMGTIIDQVCGHA